jgi:hypothetical protein
MDTKYTEWPQTIPKEKIYQHTKIFHCYTFQNLPKLFFGFENLPSGNPSSAYLGGHTSCLNQRDVGPSKLFSPLFLKHSAKSSFGLKAAKPRFEVFLSLKNILLFYGLFIVEKECHPYKLPTSKIFAVNYVIRWYFLVVYIQLSYFFRFGMIYQEKFGNPYRHCLL